VGPRSGLDICENSRLNRDSINEPLNEDILELNCQIGEPLCRIEGDGRNWLRWAKLCIKSFRAVRRKGRRIEE
jgi:hypothetical protein